MAVYKNLWWAIDHVLAGMGMPYFDSARRCNFGGTLGDYADDLPLLHTIGIRAVVCLLNIPTDRLIFEKAGFEFRCLPVPDGHAPTSKQADEFIRFAESCRSRGKPLAVFCEADIGRTGTMIASFFVHQGETAAAAIRHVRRSEPSAIETIRQIRFLEEFAARMTRNES